MKQVILPVKPVGVKTIEIGNLLNNSNHYYGAVYKSQRRAMVPFNNNGTISYRLFYIHKKTSKFTNAWDDNNILGDIVVYISRLLKNGDFKVFQFRGRFELAKWMEGSKSE